jgi:hypothetical protein
MICSHRASISGTSCIDSHARLGKSASMNDIVTLFKRAFELLETRAVDS